MEGAKAIAIDELGLDGLGSRMMYMKRGRRNFTPEMKAQMEAVKAAIENNEYAIYGLSHSGVSEYYLYCGDTLCSSSETCSTCSADCGSCSTNNAGGNNNNAGNSVSPTVIPNNTINQTTQNANSNYSDNSDSVILSQAEREKKAMQLTYLIAGIGGVIALILIIIIVYQFMGNKEERQIEIRSV